MGAPDRTPQGPKRTRLQRDAESEMDNEMHVDEPDAEATPRPSSSQPAASSVMAPPSIGTTPSRGSSGSRGSASRGSSPTKRLRTLALQDDGVEVRSLQRGARSLPASLRNMLDDFERIAGGRHILPGENKVSSMTHHADARNMCSWRGPWQAEFENEAEKDMSVSRFEGYHFAPAGARGKLGEVPSIARIKRIMSWAMHCQETAAHETTWNSAVHFPLLDMALYGDNPRADQLACFEMW
jgi:hypothetical protein